MGALARTGRTGSCDSGYRSCEGDESGCRFRHVAIVASQCASDGQFGDPRSACIKPAEKASSGLTYVSADCLRIPINDLRVPWVTDPSTHRQSSACLLVRPGSITTVCQGTSHELGSLILLPVESVVHRDVATVSTGLPPWSGMRLLAVNAPKTETYAVFGSKTNGPAQCPAFGIVPTPSPVSVTGNSGRCLTGKRDRPATKSSLFPALRTDRPMSHRPWNGTCSPYR